MFTILFIKISDVLTKTSTFFLYVNLSICGVLGKENGII